MLDSFAIVAKSQLVLANEHVQAGFFAIWCVGGQGSQLLPLACVEIGPSVDILDGTAAADLVEQIEHALVAGRDGFRRRGS